MALLLVAVVGGAISASVSSILGALMPDDSAVEGWVAVGGFFLLYVFVMGGTLNSDGEIHPLLLTLLLGGQLPAVAIAAGVVWSGWGLRQPGGSDPMPWLATLFAGGVFLIGWLVVRVGIQFVTLDLPPLMQESVANVGGWRQATFGGVVPLATVAAFLSTVLTFRAWWWRGHDRPARARDRGWATP